MQNYYYLDANRKAIGPLTYAELVRLCDTGHIVAETYVVEEGGSEWKLFASLSNSQITSLAAKPPTASTESRLDMPGVYLLIEGKQEGPYTESQV